MPKRGPENPAIQPPANIPDPPARLEEPPPLRTMAEIIIAFREECGISQYRIDRDGIVPRSHQLKIERRSMRVTLQTLAKYTALAREWQAANPDKPPGPATRRLLDIANVVPTE